MIFYYFYCFIYFILESRQTVLEFKFAGGQEDGNGEFMELISEGPGVRDEGFWDSPLVKKVGQIWLRKALSAESNKIVYIFKRENKSPTPPSVVELERKYFGQVRPYFVWYFRLNMSIYINSLSLRSGWNLDCGNWKTAQLAS